MNRKEIYEETNAFVQIMFPFSTFVLADDVTENGVDALKMSLEETKGYRKDLFMVNFYYYSKALYSILVAVLGALLLLQLNQAGFILGSFGAMFFMVYHLPYTMAVNYIFYNKVKK